MLNLAHGQLVPILFKPLLDIRERTQRRDCLWIDIRMALCILYQVSWFQRQLLPKKGMPTYIFFDM